MTDFDVACMREAVEWANSCKPSKESIPKVGAIIAVGNVVIARGRRGTGIEGDDEHAESNAFDKVKDKTQLPNSTIYTTLEPCTREVRTHELKCCSELILQHRIQRVFIGILDPNQGVTGKGILRLQESDVDVTLFPHELALQIRAINTAFIRSQQSFGVTILTPHENETLRTYETEGRHVVRFECLNPPTASNYLLVMREGLCWPQSKPFRHLKGNTWEVDAHFGSPGEHTLHIVTANDLGRTLIEYYRKVVNSNLARRKHLRDKLPVEAKTIVEDNSIMGGDYTGIQMNGLPKGLTSEASVRVIIAQNP